MSIVSRRIDTFVDTGRRTFMNRDIAVQKRARDFGEAVTPDFEMAETTARQSQSFKIMKHGNPRANESLNYIPLKCDQENSHAIGASLFNAPVHTPVAQLAIPQEYARHLDVREMYAETDVRIPPPLSLKRGIRPETRFMKIDPISVNAPTMNRPDYPDMGASRYKFPKVSYDVGQAELLRLYGRT